MSSIQEQFSQLYDQYIEKIYRFVYLKVNTQEMAEDITSRVFMKCWESYKYQKKIANPRAFLYQSARNAVVDYYRNKDRVKLVSTEAVPQIADRTDLHSKAMFSSELEQVKVALGRLKKDYQDVVILHYLEDMPVAQVAAIMERPEGTVRVMIHRALNDLKAELS